MITFLALMFVVPAGVILIAPAGERWRWTSLLLIPLPTVAQVLIGHYWRIEPGTPATAPIWATSLLSGLFYASPLAAGPALFLCRKRWPVVVLYALAQWVFSYLVGFTAAMSVTGVYL